ncbi:MAG: hypothetical protein K2Q22_07345, partial [Cytophagales bacterium]|nr:hypothetical protein [Cytophagales bacterium]
SFPVVFTLLYVGDYLTSSKKEKMLISSAKSIIISSTEKSDKLLNYSFDKKWMLETNHILDLYSNTDKHFPHVSVIVPDSIDKSKVFLRFEDYYGELEDTAQPSKMKFLLKTTKEEREYLSNVFYQNEDEVRFSASDGRYELYYPYSKNGKRIVLFFSDYQRYGKIGS